MVNRKLVKWGARPERDAVAFRQVWTPGTGDVAGWVAKALMPAAAHSALRRLESVVEGMGGPGGQPGDAPAVTRVVSDVPFPVCAASFYGRHGVLVLVWQSELVEGVEAARVEVQLAAVTGDMAATDLGTGERVLVTQGAHGVLQVSGILGTPVALTVMR
jgi:hypothetical protein